MSNVNVVYIDTTYLIGLSFVKARNDYKKNIEVLPVCKIEQYGKELQEYLDLDLNIIDVDVFVDVDRNAIINFNANFDWFKTVFLNLPSDEKEFYFIACETSTERLKNRFLGLLPIEIATEIYNWISSSLCQ